MRDDRARDREAQTLSSHDGRGVEADDASCGAHQRSTGISGIERRVGLNDAFDETTGLRTERPAQRAHDARGDGALETKRVPDRNDELADFERARVSERGWHEVGRTDGDAKNGQIRIRVVADEVGLEGASVEEGDLDALRVRNDVACSSARSRPA